MKPALEPLDQKARQTSPFKAKKENADGIAVVWVAITCDGCSG
jgi:hypothetical protein